MTILNLTLPLSRRSAIRVPRRDLVVGAGDALALRIAMVDADRMDAAPVNLPRTFARIRMMVFRDASPMGGNHDYCRGASAAVLLSAPARATASDPGAIKIVVAADVTFGWLAGGRLGWALQGAIGGNDVSLCWGALHMRPGLGMPDLTVLTDDGAQVLTDTNQDVVI